MDTPRDINSYGGVFTNATEVEDPTTTLSAAYDNRLHEDAAQMTGTTVKARCGFAPVAAAAPVTLDPTTITVGSHWGAGPAQKPVITKTATGLYTLTWPTTFTDALGLVETVSFSEGWSAVRGNVFGHVRIDTIATNVVNVRSYDNAGALTDLVNDIIVVCLF